MAHMKPAPPVIIIFFTSGRGSNLVLPVKMGASFQTPKSSKNLRVLGFEADAAIQHYQRMLGRWTRGREWSRNTVSIGVA